jgi:polysaccharide deacetylase family protein (PEP-CTERM system associated)
MALHRVFDLLDELKTKATFFVLGWVADRYPDLVRQIVDLGHEAASHGCRHVPVTAMAPEAFREDLRRSKERIQDLAGTRVAGFRAPSWSMPRRAWPYEILAELGYEYSSSRLAVPGRGWGLCRPRVISGILELPALTSGNPLFPVPAGGTVAFRVLPAPLLRKIRRGAEREGRPAVYWFHPWELVPGGPRLEGGRLFTLARYRALDRLPERIRGFVPPGDRTFRALLGG